MTEPPNGASRPPCEGGVELACEVDEETYAWLEATAQHAGRSVDEQARYVLAVGHGRRPPDLGDEEAARVYGIFGQATDAHPSASTGHPAQEHAEGDETVGKVHADVSAQGGETPWHAELDKHDAKEN